MKITENAITSDETRHTALRSGNGWELSWLPDRRLDHDQAVTGMMLAETVAHELARTDIPPHEQLRPDSRCWLHIDQWAHQLDLTGSAAVTRASEPPSQEEAAG